MPRDLRVHSASVVGARGADAMSSPRDSAVDGAGAALRPGIDIVDQHLDSDRFRTRREQSQTFLGS
jgi:hypothetical protein